MAWWIAGLLAVSATSAVQPAVERAQAAQRQVEALSWLTGIWEGEHDQLPGTQPTWTDETWSSPRGGVMLGYGRRGTGLRLGMWETMRIATDGAGQAALHVTGDDGQTVRFMLVRSGAREAVFENARHDYPQRIGYRREGNRLSAWISLADGSEERRFTFVPALQPRR